MPHKDKEKARASWRKWYATGNNADYYRRRSHRKRRELQEWFKAYKATLKCEKCPESDPICLEFHHRNRKEKDGALTELLRNKISREAILEEASKCQVLCANCHRKAHRHDRGKHKPA